MDQKWTKLQPGPVNDKDRQWQTPLAWDQDWKGAGPTGRAKTGARTTWQDRPGQRQDQLADGDGLGSGGRWPGSRENWEANLKTRVAGLQDRMANLKKMDVRPEKTGGIPEKTGGQRAKPGGEPETSGGKPEKSVGKPENRGGILKSGRRQGNGESESLAGARGGHFCRQIVGFMAR